jgi:DNA-binding response OmpR family regulator/anti-sigma regulatory factor (Ser/Thr protein kinase)
VNSKILIVDDEPANIELLEALLGPEGYELKNAKDGPGALEALKTYEPDLILLDIMMPLMSGYRVLEEIRKNEITRTIPVIFITALADREHIIKGINAGADDYISKPFDKAELVSRIRTQTGLSVLRRQINEKDKLIGIIELISDGIAVTDENFYVRQINIIAEKMLGIKERTANLAEFFMVNFGRAFEKTSDSGSFITEIPETETSTAVYISTQFRKTSKNGGDGASFLFVFRDISEDYGRNVVKVSFLSQIADKLRVPLAIISGYSNLIGTYPPHEQLMELTSALLQNSELVEKLVNRILFFSRMDNRYFPEILDSSKNVAANELDLRQMMSMFEIIYKRKFELKTEHDIVQLKKWERIVLEELIENAFKYNNKNKLFIKVVVGPEGIIVEDNGPGIDIGERENVFEPFYKVKNSLSRTPGGAGLGLSIVKRLAQSGNRIVSLESSISGGLKVIIGRKTAANSRPELTKKPVRDKKSRAAGKKNGVLQGQADLWK